MISYILRLKCTRFDFGCSAPDLAGDLTASNGGEGESEGKGKEGKKVGTPTFWMKDARLGAASVR